MVKELFKEHKFKDEQASMIDRCNAIIDEYMSQGLRMSLRQLFYQLGKKTLHLRARSGGVGGAHDYSARMAGRDAGSSIHVGKAKGGLSGGSKRLKGANT